MATSCVNAESDRAEPPSYEDAVKHLDEAYKAQPLQSNYPGSSGHGIVVYVTPDRVDYPDDHHLVSDVRQASVDATEAGLGWVEPSFSDKSIRLAFMRKVFLVLMCQLLITVGFVCLFMFCEPIREWIRTPKNFWFYYVAYGIFLVTYIALACCKSVRRNWPGNLICLLVFTLSLSCMAGTISSFHNTKIVLIAFGMVVVMCLALTLFALQTKIDFTLYSGLLFAFVMVVFLFGLYSVIAGAIMGFSNSYIMPGVWSGLMALVFSLFLVFDIQQVVGGNSFQLSPEEYIYGALHIYLDVVLLFLMIVSCSGGRS